MRSAIKGTKVQIIYQLANLPISRIFFSSHSPYTNDIGTIQEERRISEQSAKNKRLIIILKVEKYAISLHEPL